MSESAGKTFRGLQEAYASIYANKSENLTEETVVDELQEDYVINEEALHETMVNYLVHFGYASDEKKAEAILPHMGERWTDAFAVEYALAENFECCVEYLIQEEGCNFSSYTWDELYESYVKGYSSCNLNEAVFTAAATSPWWGPALLGGAAALYGLNKDKIDRAATGVVQRATDFVMGMAKGKRRLSRDRRAEAAAERLRQQQQQASQPQQPKQEAPKQEAPKQEAPKTEAPAQSSGTGSTTQGSAPQQPEPPKGPNRLQRWWNDITKGAKDQLDQQAADKAARELQRANQPPQPNPFLQHVGRKAIEYGTKIGKGAAWTGLGLGVGGLVDQGLLGGIGGKIARDLQRTGSKLGPKYDELMGRGKKKEDTNKPQNIPGF